MVRREGKIRAHIAFDTKRKFSMIAVDHKNLDGEDIVRVYQKGAPEFVFKSCSHYYENKKVRPLKTFQEKRRQDPEDDLNKDLMSQYSYMERVLERDMTKDGYRAIAFSYKDYTEKQFKNKRDFQTDDGIEDLRKNQTFIGLIALDDPLRPTVRGVMRLIYKDNDGEPQQISEAGKRERKADDIDVNVRMISGDNLDTAAAMALKAGILKPGEYNFTKPLTKRQKDEALQRSQGGASALVEDEKDLEN